MSDRNIFFIGQPCIKQPFVDRAKFLSAIRNVLDGIQYLVPALQKKRVFLFIDSSLSLAFSYRGLRFDEALSELHGLPGGADTIVRWHKIRTSYSSNFEETACRAKVVFGGSDFYWIYSLNKVVLDRSFCWLSFEGTPLSKFSMVEIGRAGGHSCKVAVVSGENGLYQITPRYEASPKHGAKAYFDNATREWVAPMPLEGSQAQDLLLISVPFGTSRWAFFRARNEYFRFVRTYPGRSVYHGFQVNVGDVPAQVISLLN